MNKFKNYFYELIKPVELPGIITNIFIAVPRIIGGLGLALYFGASKFGMPWTPEDKNLSLFEVSAWFPEDVEKFGIPFSLAPVLFAWLAAAGEAIGGLFLAIGLQTRIFSAIILITMLVAIFLQKWDSGFWSMLPAMSFLWVSVYSLILGSGKFGIDYLIAKKIKNVE